MYQVKVWLKSGAAVEFEAAEMNAEQRGSTLTNLGYKSPDDETLRRLGWLDLSQVAAIVVTGVAEK